MPECAARSPPSAPGGWLQAGRAAWVLLPALTLLLGGARRGQGGLRGALRTVPCRGQAGGHPLLAATPSPALGARRAPAPAAAKNTVLQQGSPGRGKLWAAGGRAGLFSEGCGPIPGRSILIQPAQVQQSSPEAPYLGPGGRRGWELNREHCPREEEGRERMCALSSAASGARQRHGAARGTPSVGCLSRAACPHSP